MISTAQSADAINHDSIRAMALNLGAHLDQQLGQVDHFGLSCGIFQDGTALGQHGSHHQVFSTGDSDHVRADDRSFQAAGLGNDKAMLNANVRTECRQALDVLVNRPLTDRATTRQAHTRFAKAGDERSEHQNRGTHGFDHLIGSLDRGDLIGTDIDIVAIA